MRQDEQSTNPSPSVDLETLQAASDGTDADLKELIALFYQQTSQAIENLDEAIQKASFLDIQKMGHKAAGSSAVCGMKKLGELFRQLQHLKPEEMEAAPQVLSQIRDEYQKIRQFLDNQFGPVT